MEQRDVIMLQVTRLGKGCEVVMSCSPAEFVTITADLLVTIIERVTSDNPDLTQGEVFADLMATIAADVKDTLKNKGERKFIDLSDVVNNIVQDSDLN